MLLTNHWIDFLKSDEKNVNVVIINLMMWSNHFQKFYMKVI